MTARARTAIARSAFPVGLVALLALVLLALATSAGAAAGKTSLTITFWENGAEPETKISWTLRCDPPAGTWPRRSAACTALERAGVRRAFRPVPRARICAEIFGGPQTAFLRGRVQGRRVWARFTRVNACQIARWDRLVQLRLLPG